VNNAEACALLRRYRAGESRARDELVETLSPMVRSVARRFAGRGEPLEDLCQVGMVGLIKAIDRFDLDRGVSFSTYAFPCVIGEIKRHFRDRVWAVRVPRPVKDLANRIPRERDRLSGLLGRAPTVRELAEALEADEEAVLEAVEAWYSYNASSLNASTIDHAEETELLDRVGVEESGYGHAEDWSALRPGLAALDERERQIIFLSFGRGLTQSEIAARLGYSQMHISRLLRAALDKLRDRIAGDLGASAAQALR
jgi:RNA polymerase sigma-B factor